MSTKRVENSVIECTCECIEGNGNTIHGNFNLVIGDGNTVHGSWNRIYGNRNLIEGDVNKISGNSNEIKGSRNTFEGNSNVVLSNSKDNTKFVRRLEFSSTGDDCCVEVITAEVV